MKTIRKTGLLEISPLPNSRRSAQWNGTMGIGCLAIASFVLAGCGGGGKGAPGSPVVGDMGRETVQTFGSVTTRIVGTSQYPVTSSGSDVTVTGVAGALVTDMTVAPLPTYQIAWNTLPGIVGGTDIAFRNADGSGVEKMLTLNPYDDVNPQWSPDGSKIIWQGTRNGNLEILIQNVDGSGSEINLSNNAGMDEAPQWSPDGTKIAWAATRNGSQMILVKNADGSGSEIDVSKTSGNNGGPQWSPDGTKIAWVGNGTGNNEILVRNSDGSGPLINLSNNPDIDLYPEWSPDGTKIAWAGERSGDGEILVKSANGLGKEVNISDNDVHDHFPQWSPDGTRLAWNSGSPSEIYVRSADGLSNTINVSNNPSSDSLPQWSPDGTKIVWMGLRGGETEILVKNANGIGPEINVSNNSYNDLNPQWSPVPVRQQTRLVGVNGLLGTTAAGFIIGQTGSTFGSVVTFDTAPATRANARVAAQTAPETDGPNVVFIVSAGDALTSLRYSHGNGTLGATTVIGPGAVATTATHALVSFDASTGQVSLVMPYNANRSVETKPDKAGDIMTFRGSFPAAFDGMGKNLAPDGASEVRINGRTGEVISIR